MKSSSLGLVICANAMVFVFNGVSVADDTYCPGDLGKMVISGQTVDNLIVTGGKCTVNDSIVTGNVEIKDDGDLRGGVSTIVKGNIEAVSGGGSIELQNIFVEGNIKASNAREISIYKSTVSNFEGYYSSFVNPESSTILGNLRAEGNTGTGIRDNNIHGNVEVFGNGAGGDVVRNTIRGNLVCENNETPFIAKRNQVFGEKEGQCAD